MTEQDGQEHERDLEGRQAPGLYPIGRALRSTYDAENHDSLGTDLTGLMLELAHCDDDPPPRPPAMTAAAAAASSASWRERLLARWRSRPARA